MVLSSRRAKCAPMRLLNVSREENSPCDFSKMIPGIVSPLVFDYSEINMYKMSKLHSKRFHYIFFFLLWARNFTEIKCQNSLHGFHNCIFAGCWRLNIWTDTFPEQSHLISFNFSSFAVFPSLIFNICKRFCFQLWHKLFILPMIVRCYLDR